VLPAAASAKTGLVLTPVPYGLSVGEPWNVTIRYIRADHFVSAPRGSHPFVRIISADTRTQLDFPAHGAGTGHLSARVVFPHTGSWRYTVHGFGPAVDQQSWDPVTIAAKPKPVGAVVEPKPVSAAASHDPSSFPYGWVIAGAVLALGGLLAIRVRR
jgi:hypothetical protein